MKFVIQSFSDIITNSSSEVFISAPNEDSILNNLEILLHDKLEFKVN